MATNRRVVRRDSEADELIAELERKRAEGIDKLLVTAERNAVTQQDMGVQLRDQVEKFDKMRYNVDFIIEKTISTHGTLDNLNRSTRCCSCWTVMFPCCFPGKAAKDAAMKIYENLPGVQGLPQFGGLQTGRRKRGEWKDPKIDAVRYGTKPKTKIKHTAGAAGRAVSTTVGAVTSGVASVTNHIPGLAGVIPTTTTANGGCPEDEPCPAHMKAGGLVPGDAEDLWDRDLELTSWQIATDRPARDDVIYGSDGDEQFLDKIGLLEDGVDRMDTRNKVTAKLLELQDLQAKELDTEFNNATEALLIASGKADQVTKRVGWN